MQLVADENTHKHVVVRLREAGFDVEWIKESMPGTSDIDVLARPGIGSVIFVTNDRDFGDLIFDRGMPAPMAILYSRIPHRMPDLVADRLISLLNAGVPAGQMTILTKDGNRTKPFPSGAEHG